MALLKHVAIVVSDLEKAASFYEQVFALERVGRDDLEFGSGIYLSDGVFNLALLRYKGARGSGLSNAETFVGTHHFGFVVENLERAEEKIKAAGGTFFFQLGEGEDKVNFERKFKDPDGIIFDISRHGWATAATPATKSKLRHVAIVVKDLEKAAQFYENVFELKRVGRDDLEFASGIYLSDGTSNLALLRYNGAKGSGLKDANSFVGAHHFGFIVDDLVETEKCIKEAGGTFFFQLGDGEEKENFERKFKDPDGIIFDISKHGWAGTR